MKNLSILGIRFFALFVLLRGLFSLEYVPSIVLDDSIVISDSWYILILPGLYILLAGLLFYASENIASFITPESVAPDFKLDDHEKLSAILFSSVGLLIIYWSIQDLFQSIASIVNMNIMYPDNPDMQRYRIFTMIFGGFIQLIAGILMFIGGKKLATWWNAFRNWT